jgi:hypothetical protein
MGVGDSTSARSNRGQRIGYQVRRKVQALPRSSKTFGKAYCKESCPPCCSRFKTRFGILHSRLLLQTVSRQNSTSLSSTYGMRLQSIRPGTGGAALVRVFLESCKGVAEVKSVPDRRERVRWSRRNQGRPEVWATLSLPAVAHSRGDSSILVFRRCVPERQRSSVGAELLRMMLLEGKARKRLVIRYFLRSQPARRRVVTAKPSRWTPRERSTTGAARHSTPTIEAVSSTGQRRLNPEATY